jgi:hypothetical protein
VASWLLLAGIAGVILLVRALPPVHRAIIDAGVVCALAWGTAVMLVLFVRGLRGAPMPVPPDVPGDEPVEGDGDMARACAEPPA